MESREVATPVSEVKIENQIETIQIIPQEVKAEVERSEKKIEAIVPDDKMNVDKLEHQIKSSTRFNQIHFETRYPDNRRMIFETLSSINVPNIKTQIECIPSIQAICDQFSKLLSETRYETISLPDLYDQIYNKIFTAENVTQIKKAIDTACKNSKLSLLEHHQVSSFLRSIIAAKDSIYSKVNEKKAEQPDVIDEKQGQVEMVKSLQVVLHDSGLIDYLSEAVNAALAHEFKEWDNIKQLTEDSQKAKLDVFMLQNNTNWSVYPFNQKRYALATLEEDALAALPAENKYTTMAKSFAKLNIHNLRAWSKFIEEYYSIFPDTLKEKLSQDKILQRINYYIEDKPKPAMIEVLIPSADLKENKEPTKVTYGYQDIQLDVIQFLDVACGKSVDRMLDAWNHTFELVKDNPSRKELYLFAFLQYAISKIYHGNAADDGIAWMNTTINKILLQPDLKPAAQSAMVSIALPLMLKLTEPGLVFNSLFKGVLIGYFNQNQNRCEFPVKLRDAFLEGAKREFNLNNRPLLGENNLLRAEFMRDFERKQRVYLTDLQNMIPNHCSIRDKERLVNKLLLRVAAINFMRDIIQSGVEMSKDQLIDAMTKNFGPLAFETRFYGPSHITKKAERFGELFSKPHAVVESKKESKIDQSTAPKPK